MVDIKVVLTFDEAKQLFYKHRDPIRTKYSWTGRDECGRPEPHIEYIYQWMGCGRTSWGVSWDDVPDRPRRLLSKLHDRYRNLKDFPSHGDLVFSSRKEVYPPVFYVILY